MRARFHEWQRFWTGQVFVSYARREFYFAENLVKRLEEQGAAVWFDAHRLAPGTDWEAELDAALTASNALVLVASRASLASPHVESEWRRAQAAGKPIHVVYAEAIALPPDLDAASEHDLRWRFPRGVRALREAMREPPQASRRPPPSGFRAGLAVSWIALVLLALTAVLTGLGAYLAFSVVTADIGEQVRRDPRVRLGLVAGFVAWLTFTAIAWKMLLGFLRRAFRPLTLGMWLLLGGLSPTVALGSFDNVSEYVHDAEGRGLEDFGVFIGSRPELRDWFDAASGLLFLLGVAAAIALLSAEAFRWLPTGEAVGRDPRRHGRGPGTIFRSASPKRTSETVCVHHDRKTDSDVAAQAAAALRKAGHVVPETCSETVRNHVVVVSNATRLGWVDARLRSLAGTIVCLFATSVCIPADAEALRRGQWVDYRRRSPQTLQALAGFFRSEAAAGRPAGLGLIPERLERLLVPGNVTLIYLTGVVLAAVNLGVGLAVLLNLAPGASRGEAAIRLAIAALLLWLATLLPRRRLTRGQLLGGVGLAAAALAYVGGTPLLTLVDAEWFADLDPGASVVLPGAALLVAWTTLWRWLPTDRGESVPAVETFREPARSRSWIAYVAVIALFTAGIVASPAAGE